ncbi:hypothetical protein CASFOL_001582 [Castilleja foliolosa]|uniref:Uncharacterized protein n=1 Tax=Castilleja foliolosa TaxID=1961234 RepID=A0ABD3EK79_9LAMI
MILYLFHLIQLIVIPSSFFTLHPRAPAKKTLDSVHKSIYLQKNIKYSHFIKNLVVTSYTSSDEPRADSPPAGRQETAISKRITTKLQATPARPGKATRLTYNTLAVDNPVGISNPRFTPSSSSLASRKSFMFIPPNELGKISNPRFSPLLSSPSSKAKAKCSYQKEYLATFQEARESNTQDINQGIGDGSTMPGGFSNGVFALYQMPDFVCIHLLSISREKITTDVFNDLGNWLTFGCAKLGQLLVWEWKSESYILKQQEHYFDVNCLAYSPDSQLLATRAADNKIKDFKLLNLLLRLVRLVIAYKNCIGVTQTSLSSKIQQR